MRTYPTIHHHYLCSTTPPTMPYRSIYILRTPEIDDGRDFISFPWSLSQVQMGLG
jgi:hypothetical protein